MIPTAPEEAIDLISKLMTYDPKDRLTAKEVLEHPFLADLYCPEQDSQLIEGAPLDYYDFEFEQYSINMDILRELLTDEIIMANSKKARTLNRELKERYPKGVLEIIYDRKSDEKKKAQAVKPVVPVPPMTKKSTDQVHPFNEKLQAQVEKSHDMRMNIENESKFLNQSKSPVRQLSNKFAGIKFDNHNKSNAQ